MIAVCQGLRLEKAMRLMKLIGDSKANRSQFGGNRMSLEGSLSLRLKNAKNKKSALKKVLKRLYMLRRYESRL